MAFTNCQKSIDVLPVYKDFNSDLEEKNMFGNVKSVKLWKQGEFDDSPTLRAIEDYNKQGNLKTYKRLDNDGTVEEIKERIYDDNGVLIKSITKNLEFEGTETKVISRNSDAKKATYQVYRNDELQHEYIETYDDLENITNILKIQNGDSTSVSYTYKYNNRNDIVECYRTEDNETVLLKKYTYDSNGNEIEHLIFDTYLTYKEVQEFKGNRLLKLKEYHITKQPEEFLEREVTYDDYFNAIHEKIYRDHKLITEHNMTYDYDDTHNWVKKTVETKDYIFDEDEGFLLDYTETRDIKYWN